MFFVVAVFVVVVAAAVFVLFLFLCVCGFYLGGGGGVQLNYFIVFFLYFFFRSYVTSLAKNHLDGKTAHSDNTECFKSTQASAKQKHSPLRPRPNKNTVHSGLGQTKTQSTQASAKQKHSPLRPRPNKNTVHSGSTGCFMSALASAI